MVSVVSDKGSIGITVKLQSKIREVVTSGWNNIGNWLMTGRQFGVGGLGKFLSGETGIWWKTGSLGTGETKLKSQVV